MKGILSQATAIAAICAAFGSSPRAQPQTADVQRTFRSSVDLVTIQASVRDRRGRPVRGLAPADFEVRDNGEVRPVLSLRADVRSPVSLAIVVDMSGSMNVGPKVAVARRALDALLADLRSGDDEIALFTFDSSLREREGFSTRLGSFAAALADFNPFGTTSMYDATAAAARKLAARSAGHKAVVVITDGIDTSSTLTAPEVSGIASSIDVPVYVLAAVEGMDQRAMMEAMARSTASDAADLRDLAEWTGGRVLFAGTPAETSAVAGNLIDELRQQYVLAIEAASAREWRRLEVKVRRGVTTVKARSGYFGG
jgi:VWFA-related protein